VGPGRRKRLSDPFPIATDGVGISAPVPQAIRRDRGLSGDSSRLPAGPVRLSLGPYITCNVNLMV